MDGMGGMGVWMLLWGVLGLVILALAVVGGVWIVRELTNRPDRSHPPRSTPEDIVRRRYAAGEIGEDEYRRRLSDLREGGL